MHCLRPWAVTFTKPEAHDLVGVPLGVPLHPTQLYEALAEAVIFLILYRRFSRPHQPGAIIGLYLVLYSAVRFFDDFLRDPQQPNPFGGPFNNAQWISLGLIATVVVIWLKSRRRVNPAGAYIKAASGLSESLICLITIFYEMSPLPVRFVLSFL